MLCHKRESKVKFVKSACEFSSGWMLHILLDRACISACSAKISPMGNGYLSYLRFETNWVGIHTLTLHSQWSRRRGDSIKNDNRSHSERITVVLRCFTINWPSFSNSVSSDWDPSVSLCFQRFSLTPLIQHPFSGWFSAKVFILKVVIPGRPHCKVLSVTGRPLEKGAQVTSAWKVSCCGKVLERRTFKNALVVEVVYEWKPNASDDVSE